MAETVQRQALQPLRRVFMAVETATLPYPALPTMGWLTNTQRFGYPPFSTLSYIDMDMPFTAAGLLDSGHTEYESAFAELEHRAARGEFTLAQWRHEVHSLRQRCTGGRPVPLWRRHGNVPA